jgi:hypothetical protein
VAPGRISVEVVVGASHTVLKWFVHFCHGQMPLQVVLVNCCRQAALDSVTPNSATAEAASSTAKAVVAPLLIRRNDGHIQQRTTLFHVAKYLWQSDGDDPAEFWQRLRILYAARAGCRR